jgi:hypothetical protein
VKKRYEAVKKRKGEKKERKKEKEKEHTFILHFL